MDALLQGMNAQGSCKGKGMGAGFCFARQRAPCLARAAASESSPPMMSPPPGSFTRSGEASRSRAASRLAIFFSICASLVQATRHSSNQAPFISGP